MSWTVSVAENESRLNPSWRASPSVYAESDSSCGSTAEKKGAAGICGARLSFQSTAFQCRGTRKHLPAGGFNHQPGHRIRIDIGARPAIFEIALAILLAVERNPNGCAAIGHPVVEILV